MQTAYRRTVYLIGTRDLGWDILRLTLGSMPDVRIVGNAADADDARHAIATLKPDAVLAAAVLDSVSTLPLLTAIRALSPSSLLIVFAAQFTYDELTALREIGVTGCLAWSDLDTATLPHCLGAAFCGSVVLVSRTVAQAYLTERRQVPMVNGQRMLLSPRERRVLAHLAAERTREQIAGAEKLSLRTIERIIASLEIKLGAHTPFTLGVKAALLVNGDVA